MASWATPGDVFQPVRQAHALWLTTEPQLFLEVDDLTELPEAPHLPGEEAAIPSTASATSPPPAVALGRGVFLSPGIEQRIWSKVEKTPGCWLWKGARHTEGYGILKINRRDYRAHRLTYAILVGPIPDGLELDHLCRNRAYVNPEHLEAVTRKENILRGESGSARNARKTHCHNGHPLTGDNLRFKKDGARVCLTCLRVRDRSGYARRRLARSTPTSERT